MSCASLTFILHFDNRYISHEILKQRLTPEFLYFSNWFLLDGSFCRLCLERNLKATIRISKHHKRLRNSKTSGYENPPRVKDNFIIVLTFSECSKRRMNNCWFRRKNNVKLLDRNFGINCKCNLNLNFFINLS